MPTVSRTRVLMVKSMISLDFPISKCSFETKVGLKDVRSKTNIQGFVGYVVAFIFAILC